jgi:hypothetical protein
MRQPFTVKGYNIFKSILMVVSLFCLFQKQRKCDGQAAGTYYLQLIYAEPAAYLC